MKKQFVGALQIKDNVDSTFLVKYIALMEGRDGRAYLNLILSDNTGDIEARSWGHAHEIFDRIPRGRVVGVKGKINQYQGRRQFIVSDIKLLENPKEYDESDYVVSSSKVAAEMFARLEHIIDHEIRDVYMKALIKLILREEETSRRLLVWPAGKSIHHAYQSGLLEHILSCVELALVLSGHYKVNRDFVIVGAILHDLCKIYELSSGPTYDYTDEGKLIGHVIKSLEIVDLFAAKITNFPEQTKLHLKHILLSHHGEFNYGSPKLPHTKEALLLHHIDLMDSKMGSIDQVIKNDSNVGEWSGYIKHLDRIVFKGELLSFEEGEIEVSEN